MLMTGFRDAIAANAVASIMASVQRDGPYAAEIVPGTEPQWHLLRVVPGREAAAAAHLVARRFGIYLPMFRMYRMRHGRRVMHSRVMFPGYVFLFVWDEERHRRRINACPYVRGLVFDCAGRPVVVPDQVVRDLQVIEYREDATLAAARGGKARRRRRMAEEAGPLVLTISTRRYLGDLVSACAGKRIGALKQALGLAS